QFAKEDFKLYKSATIHTPKFRIPRTIPVGLTLILRGAGGVAYPPAAGVQPSQPLEADSSAAAEGAGSAARAPRPHAAFQWTHTPPVKPVAGCIESKRGCFCYDSSMTPLDLPLQQCRAIIQAPIPSMAMIGGKNGSD